MRKLVIGAVVFQSLVIIICVLLVRGISERIGYDQGYADGMLVNFTAVHAADHYRSVHQAMQRAKEDLERWTEGYENGTLGVGCWGEGLYPSPERTYTARALSRFSMDLEEQHATE